MSLMEKLVIERTDFTGTVVGFPTIGKAMAATADGLGEAPEAFVRLTVHIVSRNEQERAQMARLVFSLGHHAEVYTDIEELVEHAPTSGVVLARETEDGFCPAVVERLTACGLWLPLLGFAEQLSIDAVVRGLKSGVLDYLVGAASTAQIARKLQSCHAEALEILEAQQHKAEARRQVKRLSHREFEVLSHLAKGYSNKEIARALEISPRTVEIHRMKMMGKIGAHHCAEAIRIYLEASNKV